MLGRGPSGVVYKAHDQAHDRIVALKWFREGRAGSSWFDPGAIHLRLPEVVPILATGRHEGAAYRICEYIEGTNLAEHVGSTPRPFLAAAHMVEILARAVHEAHQQGQAHGNLKPENVLLALDPSSRPVKPEPGHPVDEEGRRLIPRLSDFGVPGRCEPVGPGAETACYLAPEQETRPVAPQPPARRDRHAS